MSTEKRGSAGRATGGGIRTSDTKRKAPKRVKAQRRRGDPVYRKRVDDVLAVPGERILNWTKERQAPQQAHSPGKCGRCLGKTFDVMDGRGLVVWYCGLCDVVYDNS